MPVLVGRPASPRWPCASDVDGEADRSADDNDRTDASHQVRRTDEAHGNNWCSDGQTYDRQPRADMRDDPCADDGWEEVQHCGRDHERDEADQVQPAVGRLDDGPVADHWWPAGHEQRCDTRSHNDLDEGGDIPLDDQATTRAQRLAERAHGGRDSQHDPADIGAAADHSEPGSISRKAESDAGGAESDGSNGGDPQPHIARRRCRKGRDEERHHASDRGRGGTRQRQMKR